LERVPPRLDQPENATKSSSHNLPTVGMHFPEIPSSGGRLVRTQTESV
jgi:hypothetical protein